MKRSYYLGQFCGLSKMHLVCVHAAFRISAWPKYAMSGVRSSRAVVREAWSGVLRPASLR
jgi:hypothetical protein